MTVDALTFDLDGTLIDTAGEIAAAVNRTLADADLAPRPIEEIAGLIGHGLPALGTALLQRLRQEQLQRIDARFGEWLQPALERHYAALVGTVARPYPGVAVALARLADAGVPLACVTNKAGGSARRLLDAGGLSAWLPQLVAGDSLPQRKPDARVLRHAADLLGVPVARLAHVGDSRTDVAAARNAGAVAWAVPYGYDGGEPVALARPNRLFAGLPEVADHVLHARQGS